MPVAPKKPAPPPEVLRACKEDFAAGVEWYRNLSEADELKLRNLILDLGLQPLSPSLRMVAKLANIALVLIQAEASEKAGAAP